MSTSGENSASAAGRSQKAISDSPTLEEYLNSEYWLLQVGDRTPIARNWCKHCRSTDLYMEVRLEADNPSGCLAGTQVKTTAHRVYVLCCASCGRYSGDRRNR